MIYVPASCAQPAPLLITLHGAGSTSERAMRLVQAHVDRTGTIVIAPQSFARTWDLIVGRMGPDIEGIAAALALVFAQHDVDRARIAISGFSDGASYALTVGLANGDLITHVIAFSPGFLVARYRSGKPRVFVSHGVDDGVLPIERCGRRIAAALDRDGYDAVYREYAGAHSVPPEIAGEAIDWFTDSPPRR